MRIKSAQSPPLIPYDELRRSLDIASEEFKQLSYQQLEQMLAAQSHDPNNGIRTLEVNGVPVFVATMLSKFGRIRKRISVELTVGGPNVSKTLTPCVYFERLESGELREPKMGKIGMFVFLFVFPAIGLISLVWLLIRIFR